MSFFDLFKKKVEVGPEIVSLKFDEVEDWVNDFEKGKLSEEEKVILGIKEKINIFVENFEKRIAELENFDLNSVKEKERIKKIVDDSREAYLDCCRRLIAKLQSLDCEKLEKDFEKINDLVSDFNKKSYKHYERATYLIGKEMANLKDVLKNFSLDVLNVFEKNKILVNSLRKVSDDKILLDKIFDEEKNKKDVSDEMENFDLKIKELKNSKENLIEKIKEIKSSSRYLGNLKLVEEKDSLKKEINSSVLGLKGLIDFKKMVSFYHTNSRELERVKIFKEHFVKEFLKNDKEFFEMLKNANLSSDKILEKRDLIFDKVEKLDNLKDEITDDEIEGFENEIVEIDERIKKLNLGKLKMNKHLEKLDEDLKELMEKLKVSLRKLNVEMVE